MKQGQVATVGYYQEHINDSGDELQCLFCGRPLAYGGLVKGYYATPQSDDQYAPTNVIAICRKCLPSLGELAACIWSDCGQMLQHITDEEILNSLSAPFYKELSFQRRLKVDELQRDLSEAREDLTRSIRETEQVQRENDRQRTRLDEQSQAIKDFQENAQYVYLMKRKDGAHKIGLTNDTDRRLAQIQREFEEVELLHTIKCDDMRAAESMLHSYFSDQRLDGEWFDLGQSQIDYIYSLTRFEDGWFLRRSITSDEIPY